MIKLRTIGNQVFVIALVLFGFQCVSHGALIPFSGSATQNGGKENVAFEAWDAALTPFIALSARTITFDEPITGNSVPLNTYPGGAVVGASPDQYVAIEDGGNAALFPLFVDGDNLVRKGTGSGFIGIGNPKDLRADNENLLFLGPSKLLRVNFDEINNGAIETFGTTAGVGGFFSTTSQVSLEIFDFNANSIGILSATPGTLEPFFLGFFFDDASGNIATAQFTLSGSGAFDGLVFASPVDAGVNPPIQPPLTTVPIPAAAWLFITGLAGLMGLGPWRKGLACP